MNKIVSNSNGYGCKSPTVMGIVNVTPDSFFSGSRCDSESDIIKKVEVHIKGGASIIDIGACSTRPGSMAISEREELDRLLPALATVRKKYPKIPISVDTFRGEVAKKAVQDYEVDIVNDVYAFDRDEKMLDVVAQLNVPYVLMHYGVVDGDVVACVKSFFEEKLRILRDKGVKNIILDPGYGFGKTMEQNFELLSRQGELQSLHLPVLAGLSRKRMVWQTLESTPEDALNGTTVLNVIALQQGASILRVHDSREAYEAIGLLSLCRHRQM